MKALWLVSFRPLKSSRSNDFNQSLFVDSVKSIDFDITFSITQFDEKNVKEFVDSKNIKSFYKNVSKVDLPLNKKYSNKIMLENSFQYLIYSTADIMVPNNLFEVLKKINRDEYCAIIYPNTHVTNGVVKSYFWHHYGIDLIIFKISKTNAIKFKEIIKFYNQYDWGIVENFYISISEFLKLKTINIFKYANVLKFENDFKAFTEDRTWQIKSWNENRVYFLNFLKHAKLSKLYANGSYYYLLLKIFNFKDLNLTLVLSYLIFYPYNIFKKIFRLVKRK